MNTEPWDPRRLPDLRGTSALVTGGSAGIGLHVAEQLAAAGARVTIAARSADRTRAALEALRVSVPDARVGAVALDLTDPGAIREAAAAVAAEGPLDMLVNNAGITSSPRRTETAEGHELMLAANHLGHFALTLLLLPSLAHRARVVSVGSLTHRRARMDFDDLQCRRSHRSMTAYGRSKLATLLFAFELDHRLRAVGSTVVSVAAHPGWAVDGLTPARPPMLGPSFGARVRSAPLSLLAQGKDRGAWPIVRAATDPAAWGGEYYGPSGFGSLRGVPEAQSAAEHAHDRGTAARLWEASESLTGVRWPGRP
ncbi:oxidoreductase [Streptomyces wuyuanensis]|uniref:oxidoreductase n=1 Tax=Streptomyces wuyuanensis TaxID=1196353 RepID=UPI003423848F